MFSRNKLVTMVATVVISGMSITATTSLAEANALENAFDRLSSAGGGFSSSNSAASFETRTRHGYTAGGFDQAVFSEPLLASQHGPAAARRRLQWNRRAFWWLLLYRQ